MIWIPFALYVLRPLFSLLRRKLLDFIVVYEAVRQLNRHDARVLLEPARF